MPKINFGLLLVMLAATLALGGGWLARYLGAFKPVELIEIDSPGFTLLVKKHFGAYHQIVPTLNEVEQFALRNQIPCSKTVGAFYDDPQKTEQSRLKAMAGCWLGPGRIAVATPLPPDFEVQTIVPQRMLEAVFSGSPAIGPWKVYPQVKAYFADHKRELILPNFEIYDFEDAKRTRMTTHYLFTLGL